jgi:hypothetical protein
MTLRGPRRSCWTAQSTRSAAGRRPPRRARAARQGAPAGACAAVGGRKGEVARAAEVLSGARAGLGRARRGRKRRRNGELLGGVKVDGDGTSGKKMEWEKR